MSSSKMTIQHADDAGFWIVSFETDYGNGEQLSFSIRQKKSGISVGDLERAALAAVRDRLSSTLDVWSKVQ